MKNKIMTIFLITAVLGIWGLVLFRLFSDQEPDAVKLATKEMRPVTIVKQQFSSAEKQLVLNYRDPFLNKYFKPKAVDTMKPVAVRRQVFVELVNWSALKYTGYIENPGTKNLTAMIRINNKDYMLSEGDMAEGFRLIKNNKESVIMGWKKQTKLIKL